MPAAVCHAAKIHAVFGLKKKKGPAIGAGGKKEIVSGLYGGPGESVGGARRASSAGITRWGLLPEKTDPFRSTNRRRKPEDGGATSEVTH